MSEQLDLDALLALSPLPPSSPLTELPIRSSSYEPPEQEDQEIHDCSRPWPLIGEIRDPCTPRTQQSNNPNLPDDDEHAPPNPNLNVEGRSRSGEHHETTPPLPRTPRSLQIVDMGSEGIFIGADSNDPGVKYSSPVLTTKARRKREAKRQATITKQKAQRAQAHEERLLEEVRVEVEAQRLHDAAANHAQTQCFRDVLELLERSKTTWGDFVEWISMPTSGFAQQRYDGLFRNRDHRTGESQVQRILNLWSTRNSPTGRTDVHAWAIQYTSRVVSQEAHTVTKDGVLLTRRQPFTGEFLLSFSFTSIHDRLRVLCPSMNTMLHAFTTTARQRKLNKQNTQTPEDEARTGKREARKERVSQNMPIFSAPE